MKKILLLLVAMLAATSVWAADFITDVMVIGGSKSEVNNLKTTYTNQGWTFIDQDLNAGCGSSSDYIYMLYMTGSNASQDAGAFITDFYISSETGTAPDNVVHNGRTYTLVPCDGSTYFINNKGDLNSHCGSSSATIHLYYCKDDNVNYSSKAVNSITFNDTQSGAIGENGGTTGYDLNTGCGSSSDYIYMHAATAAKGWTASKTPSLCTITGYQGTKSNWTSLTVPLYIDGVQVENFTDNVFSGFTNLVTLAFYDNTIVSQMPLMQGCSNFKHVKTGSTNDKTPNSMTSIPASAFVGTAIESITLPSVTSVGANAFQGCGTLNSVKFNKEDVTIGNGAFSFIVKAGGAMCQITYPGSINDWNGMMVMCSPSLIVNGSSGSNAWYCGWCGGGSSSSYNRLFWKLDAAGQLKIDCADNSWNDHPSEQVITTFNWDKSKVKTLTLEHVYSIAQYEFNGYSNLVTVDVKSGLTSIGDYAFKGCSLSSVSFSVTDVSIGYGAFSDISSNCQITYPGSIYDWNGTIIMYSPNLIVNGGYGSYKWYCGWCGGGSSSSFNRLFWKLDAAGQLTIDCADNSWANHPSDQVINTHNWDKSKVKTLTLEHVYSIAQYEFNGYSNLITVNAKSGVTSVGDYAFMGCSLSSVSFDETNVAIGDGAFSNISSNCQITYPGSIDAWGPSKYIYSPNLVVNGGSDSSTWNCGWCGGADSTSNNTLYWTFDASGNLKIDCADNSWADHPSEQVITTHNWDRSKVITLTLEHVYSIALIEFQDFYTNLVTVDVKSGVTSIDNFAFNNCHKLSKVYLPSCLESIGAYVFRNCELLTDLFFDGTQQQWDNVTKGTGWNNFVSDDFTEHWRCTVTFDANGHGTAPASQTLWSNYDKVTEPTPPTAIGYSFKGWFTNAACTKRWYFNNIVPSDMTLYAKWVAVSVSVPGDVNSDGSVTSADVTALYNYLLDGDQTFAATSDVDGDGNITSGDITFIYNILLGN